MPAPSSRGRGRRGSALPFLLLLGAVCALLSPWNAFIAVFGGTGLTGREIVYQALQRGEEVRVLARDPAKMLKPLGSAGDLGDQPIVDDMLTVIQGDVMNTEDVAKVIDSGVTSVIVALGGKTKDVGATMLSDGTANIVEAMKKVGAKRIVVVTSIGVGDSDHQAPLFFKILMRTMMRSIFADKNRQEELFTDSDGVGADLDFTIVRPGGLTVEAPTGTVNVIEGKAGSIARADVADFCLGAVLEPDSVFIRKTPCISSIGGTAWTKDRSETTRTGEAEES
jgi:uncharacterized protein YbjT (DUF2867 family)